MIYIRNTRIRIAKPEIYLGNAGYSPPADIRIAKRTTFPEWLAAIVWGGFKLVYVGV